MDILLSLSGMNRKKGKPGLILDLTVPHAVQFCRFRMKIITHRLPHMTAARMNHDAQISILILLKPSQAPHLEIPVFDQRQQFGILLIFVYFLFCTVKHL